jgi:predicted MFS family arabinose efflux permease
MSQQMTKSRAKAAQTAIILGFFTQAFVTITYIPRIPELIDQINVTFDTWGLIMGMAGLGSFLPLIFANRIISKFGTRPVIQVSSVLMCLSILTLPFTHNAWVFFGFQLALSFFGTFFNISLNSQSVMFQNKVGTIIIGRFHAAWSIGAVASSALGGLLATFAPLWLHMLIVTSICAAVFTVASRFMMSPAEDGHAEETQRSAGISFFKSPLMMWWLAAGLFAAIFAELSLVDWSAIFAKNQLGLNASLGAIPYTVFAAAMIIGRLAITPLAKKYHISRLSNVSGVAGGIALLISAFAGPALAQINPIYGLLIVSFLWVFVGLGVAPMVPSYFTAAGYVKGLTTSQVLARISLIIQVSMLLAKVLMGATAQQLGLITAFMLPGASLIIAGLVAAKAAKRTPRSAAESVLEPAGI